MGYSVGYDSKWERDIGYGVPTICDHPNCDTEIDRGLGYVCGGSAYGGAHGCGLFFCGEHLSYNQECGVFTCDRCPNEDQDDCYSPTQDTDAWVKHKLTDPSWIEWREENKDYVEKLKEQYP